jgi:hypothetical protein
VRLPLSCIARELCRNVMHLPSSYGRLRNLNVLDAG